MTQARKAKRRLQNFNFEDTGAHVALVGPAVGGAANGYETLVTKSTKNFSDAFMQKAQQVQVTLELPEFLRRFFGMWYEDAEVLARLLGYVPPVEEEDESETEEEDEMDEYESYIQSRLEAFEVLKSLSMSESISDCIAKLSEEEMLAVLNDQAIFEKALAQAKEPVAEAVEGSIETPVDETGSVNKSVDVGIQTKPTVVKKEETQVTIEAQDVIAKSEYEVVLKSLDEQRVELQKALDKIAEYEEEKKAALAKARKDAIAGVVGEEKAAVLFKALGAVETDEVFNEVLEVVKALADAAEKTELFVEKGASTETEVPVQKSTRLADILKAKYQAQA